MNNNALLQGDIILPLKTIQYCSTIHTPLSRTSFSQPFCKGDYTSETHMSFISVNYQESRKMHQLYRQKYEPAKHSEPRQNAVHSDLLTIIH